MTREDEIKLLTHWLEDTRHISETHAHGVAEAIVTELLEWVDKIRTDGK